MLKFFTRLEKTRNFVLFLFAILMVGSLVFFYTPARNTASANLSQSGESVASVEGDVITVGELVRQRENQARGRGQTQAARTTLDQIITGRIIAAEAERLGLTASDPEVAAEIREDNKPIEGKTFDQAIYEQNITEMYGNIGSYEQSVRNNVSWGKVYAFITSGVTVSEEQVLEEFQKKNTKFALSFVSVNSAELAKTITPTDAELREYFDKNKQSYYVNVPQKKVKYVFVNTAKIGEKMPITDVELKTEFDNLAPDKKIAGVMGQEIVLRIAKPEFEGEVQTRASELAQRLKKDGETTVTEEAFAELAKGYSENPVTAPNGGRLSGPVTQNPNKPNDPYQQLLKMKPGEVSAPVNYEGRYFILRRGEDVMKTFETAKKELEVSLRNRRAYSVAAELAQKVVDSLKQTKDPLKTAQAFAAEANMSAAAMVRETDYVKPGDEIANIGVSPQFEEGIAPLANVGDVGEKTPIKDGFAVPMLADKKEPRDAEFDEVKTQIVDVVKLEKARAQVEDIAKQIATNATNAAALGSAASAKGLKVQEKKDFILGSPLGEGASASTSEALQDAIYAMQPGDVTKTPIKSGDNWYIVGVTGREDAKTDDFATQRSSLMTQMIGEKRNAVFTDYLAAVKQRMEAAGDIVIYKEALEKVDAATPPAPPRPQGMPQGFPQGFPAG